MRALTDKEKELSRIYARTNFPAQGSALNDVQVAEHCIKQTFEQQRKQRKIKKK